MNKGKLFVISGASGVGKSTVLRKVMDARPDLRFSVSATTRDPRPGEVDGVLVSLHGATQSDASNDVCGDVLTAIRAEVGEGIEGVISDYIDSPMNPLFELRIDGQEVLIPAVDEFVTEIDIEQKVVVFELPEGMLSLND